MIIKINQEEVVLSPAVVKKIEKIADERKLTFDQAISFLLERSYNL